jgi:hypothetical protein
MRTHGEAMTGLGQTVRQMMRQKCQEPAPPYSSSSRVLTNSGKTLPLKGQMTLTLAWIAMMAFVMTLTLKNMYYLQKESQIRELLLTPQDYAELFPLNSLEVDKEEFLQYVSKSDANHSGTSVCFDETGNMILTLWENNALTPMNRMWIHGRLKKNFENVEGNKEKPVPEEFPLYPTPESAKGLLLKLAAFMTGTTLIGLALYYSSSQMKNFVGMAVQLGWMVANLYWVELVEGGFSKLMDAIICGMVRLHPFY